MIADLLPIRIDDTPGRHFDTSTSTVESVDISSIPLGDLPAVDFAARASAPMSRFGRLSQIFRRLGRPQSAPDQQLSRAYATSAQLVELPADEILQRLDSTFYVREISLLDTVSDRDYVFAKVNHRCWEEITSIGLDQAGKEYIRAIDAIDRECISSRFYESLFVCLAQCQRAASTKQSPKHQCRLCTDEFAFGISLTGGNASYRDDLVGRGRDARVIDNIYASVTVGTAAGLVGFFSALADGNRTWFVADGAAPKTLFWKAQFGSFMEKILNTADAILFIVPPWLADITISGRPGIKVFTLVVPGEGVDTLWGLVAPVALQYIAELSRRYRLTVLSQCSVVSALVGMMTHLHLTRSAHRTPCRFYDLGQLLDLANVNKPESGYWLSREDVRAHATRTNDWSNMLGTR